MSSVRIEVTNNEANHRVSPKIREDLIIVESSVAMRVIIHV